MENFQMKMRFKWHFLSLAFLLRNLTRNVATQCDFHSSQTLQTYIIFSSIESHHWRSAGLVSLSQDDSQDFIVLFQCVSEEKTLGKFSYEKGEKWALDSCTFFVAEKFFAMKIMKGIIRRDVRYIFSQSCFNLTSFQINFLFLPEKKEKNK